MRWLLILLVCFGCGDDDVPLGDAGPGSDAAQVTTPTPDGCGSALEVEEFDLTNDARADEGRPALICDADLAAVARAHSADMCAREYFDHNNLEGQSPGDRVSNAGLAHRGIGENIAAGNGTASETHTQWMNSSGHRGNILSANYTRIGVGYAMCPSGYRHYWTQVFARSN
ncbi:MAG: hypothetical protein ACI9KE_001097 [Polyangiales bacterium]|jgi:uncharacterized protein YkwD